MRTIRPFTLERAYREQFITGMFDLSSSSPQPLTARAVLDEADLDCASLLDATIDYEPSGGSRALREAVASLYANVDASQVLITAGAAEAIRVVSEAAIHPGDRVVLQQPSYQGLRAAADARGACVVEWPASRGFQFGFSELPLEAASASALLLNNPHGPSGSLVRGSYSAQARLIADEVYRPAALVDGMSTPSIIDASDTAVSIGDLSKPLGLGGLRIGWIVSRDQVLLRECSDAVDYFSGSVSSLSARLALAAIRHFGVHLHRHLSRARANLRLLTTFMEQHGGWLDWNPPQAGYTAFLRLIDGASAEALARRMRNRGVFLLDGCVFDSPDHIRVGFGQETEGFTRALAVLSEELRVETSATGPAPAAGDVILLAKEPAPGRTKTRLGADIGNDHAAALSSAFIRDSLEIACSRARRVYIAASPPEALSMFRSEAPRARCFAQPDAEFGARLLAALQYALHDGATRPVLIGSDSPTLPSHLISVAHRALATHDVVLGPAEDGGYYLIGMNAGHSCLFERIAWSTDEVLRQTLERARAAHLSVFLLPPWYDIDTGRDLDRLKRDRLLGEHTRAVLESRPLEAVVR